MMRKRELIRKVESLESWIDVLQAKLCPHGHSWIKVGYESVSSSIEPVYFCENCYKRHVGYVFDFKSDIICDEESESDV